MSEYPCYIIHVKEGYEDREQSIIGQFSELEMPFEWVLEHDIPDLDHSLLEQYRYHGTKMGPAEISCSMKHIAAWEKIVTGNSHGGFIFEDDVLIDLKHFRKTAFSALAEFQKGGDRPGYLSLGDGCAMFVPWTRLERGRLLYPAEQVRATDSYFISRSAAVLMLETVKNEGFSLPADHLINRLCHINDVPILWLSPTIVSQGSHTGRFASQIQPWDQGKLKEKFKWVIKKIRRKYIYPVLGVDSRRLGSDLRNDLGLDEPEDK